MNEYKGLLAKKIEPPNPFDLPGNTDLRARLFKGDEDGLREDTKYSQARVRDYVEACAAREAALFAHFEIDQTSNTAWRDLALALAAKHVPAFNRKLGRPSEYLDEITIWALDFAIIKTRDKSSDAKVYRTLAGIIDEDVEIITNRLKDFKVRHRKNWNACFKLIRLAGGDSGRALSNEQLLKLRDNNGKSKT